MTKDKFVKSRQKKIAVSELLKISNSTKDR